ncbi:MAG: extracellular solute-binding protein [Alphaproteobacteria bacterium]|nr:extracellular solute-binding protein [Alphaproteobacteria bacterium]
MRRAFLLLPLTLLAGGARAEDRFITLASTTSTENSGLFSHLIPKFTEKTGIFVRIIAVGTGQAMKIAERGDPDVLLVHDRKSEDKFVADGFGIDRRDVMANDFVVVGPAADPAGIAGLRDVAEAFRRIAAVASPFVSRGDDSGTHKAELRHWKAAGVDPKPASGTWYREAGSGMGATLNTAAAMDGYTLADRATWASFGNRGTLEVLVEGDPKLFNPYGVILVNPARHAHVKEADARAFMDWLTGPEGRAAIASFRVDGQQVFFAAPPAGS